MSGAVDVDPTISALAARQDGVVTRRHLLALEIAGKRIDHRVKTDRLIVVFRGVYAVGHETLSDRGRIRAALFAAGRGASTSHTTAAYLDHLTPTLPAVIHVTTTGCPRRGQKGLQIHRTTRPFAPRVVGGFRATPTLRTLEYLGWPDKLVREAAARGLIRPQDVPSKVDATPTQSKLERRMRRLCADAGLPQPIAQYPIPPYKIDFAWPEHRVLVETDGWGTHGRRQAFEDDRAKDADLVARGYVVIRFTWRQLEEEPYTVAARLAAALALRDASTPSRPEEEEGRAGRGPAGGRVTRRSAPRRGAERSGCPSRRRLPARATGSQALLVDGVRVGDVEEGVHLIAWWVLAMTEISHATGAREWVQPTEFAVGVPARTVRPAAPGVL